MIKPATTVGNIPPYPLCGVGWECERGAKKHSSMAKSFLEPKITGADPILLYLIRMNECTTMLLTTKNKQHQHNHTTYNNTPASRAMLYYRDDEYN